MAETRQKYYLTTPIYYVNARPHIGHAYTTIVADVVARRQRLLGNDVWFLTGTDEHGQKIERAAKAAGTSPQEFADSVSAQFEGLWKRMGITNDQYIRTTDEAHKRGVQKLFSTLKANGFIYLNAYTGAYCVSDEAFVDAPVGTPCPDCGRLLEEVTEENYFFKLSAFQEKLIDLIESGTMDVQPETRKNEVLSFLRGGLKDLSISRSSFSWGVPVPGDPKHVIYVWLDALANYITALGYGNETPEVESKFEKYWPADLHLVGKEIIRFHCVYWPAFLMAAGLPLPKKIVAHGWLLFEESKMSKSRGNIVRAETILDAFGSLKPEASKAEQDLFGADVLRYFLLREIPFGNDGSFSFDALVQRYNSDLANGYGNLVSRVLAMIQKNFDGVIPVVSIDDPLISLEELTADLEKFVSNPEKLAPKADPTETKGFISVYLEVVEKCLDDQAFHGSLKAVQIMISTIDQMLTTQAPWKIDLSNQTEQLRLKQILFAAVEGIRLCTALLYPFMPYSTAKVWAQLGLGDIEVAAKNGELNNLQWGGLRPGTKLGTLGPIFPRADKELITRMNEIEQNNAPVAAPAEPAVATPAAPAAPENVAISIDDFMKVELRVAQIKVAERIPKADKLLRLEVDLGHGETRQILSGIAEHYTPEELIGRRIVIVANLAPRKMRGLESHGMLLAASVGDGDKPVLATVPEDAVLGSRVR